MFRKRFHKGGVAAAPLVSRRCYSNKAKERLIIASTRDRIIRHKEHPQQMSAGSDQHGN